MANKITPSIVTEVIHYTDGEKEIEVLASEKAKFAKHDYEGNEIISTYLKKDDAEGIYVKKTDEATTSAFGVVKVGVGLEINTETGALDVTSAGKVDWTGVENRPFNSVNAEDFTIEGTTDSDKVLKVNATKWATKEALETGLDAKLDKDDFNATNIVSKLGTTPVNRATSDASGNDIAGTYETKTNVATELAKKVDLSVYNTFANTTVPDTYETKADAKSKKEGLESAIALKLDESKFNTFVNTTAPATYLGINDVASATKLGSIKIGYTDADRKFAVKLDSENKAYVEVPEYELPIASATTLGGIKIGSGLAISEEGVVTVDVEDIDVKWTKVSGKPFESVSSTDFVTSGNELGINSTTWLQVAEAKRTYEIKEDASAKLTEAKEYTDSKIGALDYTSKGADGSYVQKVSEADGVVSETIKAFDTTISEGSTSVNAPTSKAVEDRIQEVVGGLDVAQVGSEGKFIELVSEADGKVSATAKDFIDSITDNKDSLVAPTTKAIKQYVDDLVSAGVDIEVVEELPTASKDTKGKFYFVAHSHEGEKDIYDEYVTVVGGTSEAPTYSWEKIGNTDIDLSAYVKGSNLTSNKIILGNGGVNVIASAIEIATALGDDDSTIATSKAIQTELAKYVLKTLTINGHALSSNVTITKSDVELGNVANTGDSATPVANGTTKFTTGGAYTLKSDLETAIGKKQDTLTAGTGITISSNTIGINLVAGDGITISGNTISSNLVATSTTIDY